MVFRTAAGAAAVLSLAANGWCQTLLNPHFATPYNCSDANTCVANSWTPYRILQNPQFKQSDFEQMPGGPGGQVSCQQIWADWSAYEAGIYQRITGATPGQTYRLSGWMLSIYKHGAVQTPPYQDGYIFQKIGIDPTGGTNPSSANIVWSWDDLRDRVWREIWVDATAQGSAITVFARTRNTAAATNCLSFFDAFGLRAADPVRITNLNIRPGLTDMTFTWTTDVPADSKVNYVRYRGSSKDYSTVSDSAPVTQHSITVPGLSADTQYYCQVISSALGRDFGISGGHLVSTMSGQQFSTLAAAKDNPDGTRVYVRDLVVTSGSSQSTTYLFVQQPDRSSGIRVEKGSLVAAIGDVVDISGTLATVSGERWLMSAAIARAGSTDPAEALALAARDLGGAAQGVYNPGVAGGAGPHNIGLLVRVWGRIGSVNTAGKYFYIDDGCGLWGGTAADRYGVRVSYYYTTGAVAPVAGRYALVTGMSSCARPSGSTIRQVLLRSPADLVQMQPP